MGKIRGLVNSILHQLPGEGRIAKEAYRKLQMKKEIAIANLIGGIGKKTLPSPYTRYWVDPKHIQLHTNYKTDSSDWEDWVFDQNKYVAQVQNGDWDIAVHRVEDMRVFRAINDRIHHGVAWQSTEYYQDAIRQIENGRELWGCLDRLSFDKRCNEIDHLIESISTQGYRARVMETGDKEILINISREGFCLFQDGRHRLAIARALQIKQVPVQILARHSDWQSFRIFMHNMARGEGGASKRGVLYQAPMHFDLADIPYEHACTDRWEVIKSNLDEVTGVRALDIGSNLGFFCHQLEECGYSCIGVEYVPTIAWAAQKIACAENRKLAIVTGDILSEETQRKIAPLDFSVVIALNIFHHFIKTKDGYEKLRQFMNHIRIGTMFFESHHEDEPQMQGVFSNPTQNEFVKLIKEWGGFERVEPIYVATGGRILFKLDRQHYR